MSLIGTINLHLNDVWARQMSEKIFISYRRDDSPAYAGWLFDRLSSHFGRDNVFRDVDAIEPGRDFVSELSNQVSESSFFIAVVGPKWLDSRDKEGLRRLDDPNDFVRIEIEAALALGVRIVPALVDGAAMPSEAMLPESLRPFARRNAISMTHEKFGSETGRLFEIITDEFLHLENQRQQQKIIETQKTNIETENQDIGRKSHHFLENFAQSILIPSIFTAFVIVLIFTRIPHLWLVLTAAEAIHPFSYFEGILSSPQTRSLSLSLIFSLATVFHMFSPRIIPDWHIAVSTAVRTLIQIGIFL